MKPAATHEQAQMALGAAALDALSDVEHRALLAHVATCAECALALESLRETAAALADTAPPAPRDSARDRALRDRLVTRAAADVAARRGPSSPAASTSLTGRASSARSLATYRWVAIAASLAFVAALVVLGVTRHEQTKLRDSAARTLVDQRRIAVHADSLQAALANDERLLSALTGPEVHVVELTSTGRQPPTARMFWDRATNRWTFFVNRLPPARQGRTYQLWLVTANAKISAGTFAPDSSGRALVRAEYPLPANALQAVAVTEEPAGGVPQPTGTVVLAGNAGR